MTVVFVEDMKINTYHNTDKKIKKNNNKFVTLTMLLLKFLNLYACILTTANKPHSRANKIV